MKTGVMFSMALIVGVSFLLLVGLLVWIGWRQSSVINPTSNVNHESSGRERSHLARLRSVKVVFGHMSVGEDVIAGVRELGRGDGEPGVAVFPLKNTEVPSQPGLWHLTLGHNADPVAKIRRFEEIAKGFQNSPPDAVMMKLCYVDIVAASDLERIQRAYRDMVKTVEGVLPRTRVLHVTTPLEAAPVGKAKLRRAIGGLIGRAGPVRDNGQREAYNKWLRREYGSSGTVLDLAQMESNGAQGSCVARFDSEVPMMYSTYTDDGGHLNRTGRKVVASAFLMALSQAVSR